MMPHAPETQPVIGISACLTGERVRYDGTHKRQALALSVLAPRADLKPFCPEAEAGLGVPRPAVELIQTSAGRVRALGVADASLDVTDALEATAAAYDLEPLSGFVFKSRSPSCGLGSTPLSNRKGEVLGHTHGLFADRITTIAPWLACVEESWLCSPERCYRFLSACCTVAYFRHGRGEYEELIAALRPLLLRGEAETPQAMEKLVRKLLSSQLSPDEKAALEGRLLEYWRQR